MKLDTSALVNSCIRMKQPLTHILILLFFLSSLSEVKGRGRGRTHVVKHNKKWWKIKTINDGAKEEGNDYQEDDSNSERFFS